MSRKKMIADDVKRALRSNATPDWIREMLPRQLDNMVTEMEAASLAAAYFRDKADQLIEAKRYASAMGEATTADELRQELARQKRINESIEARAVELERTVNEKSAHLMRLTAGEAVAVHSED